MQPLRPYQARAISEARAAYRAGARAPLIVSPTGSGKTRVGVELVSSALAKGAGGVLWLAHREELLRQARDRLLAEGLPRVGILAPWAPYDVGAPVQACSTQTLGAMRRKGRAMPRGRVVVLDEAHHYAADEWGEVATSFPDAILLGLTATPERGDGRPLGKSAGGLFDALVTVASIRELQATVDERTGMAILVPIVTYAPEVRTKDLARSPVSAYLATTPGERAFCFCASVDHAETEAAAFRANGVPATTIHADTPWRLRGARLEAFRLQSVAPLREAGSVEDAPIVICNVYTMTEGVDVPEATTCIMARRIGHAGMQMQAVGRVLRSAPGKDRATLIDLCGNVHAHGLPETDRTYSLDGKAIRETEEKADRICACRICGAVFSAWRVDATGARTCPVNGCAAPKPKPVRVSPRELIAMGHVVPPEQKRDALWRIAAVALERKFAPGWVTHRYRERFGEWPAREDVEAAMRRRGEVA